MKKTMIIALLAVLVLGVFIACDGDVNADLVGGKREITLIVNDAHYGYGFSFDGSQSKVLEIPADCKTWAEYLAKVKDIKLMEVYNEHTQYFPLAVYEDGKIYFMYNNVPAFGLLLKETKGGYSGDSTNSNAEIIIGGTYEVKFDPT